MNDKEEIKKGSFRAWILAARPKTLTCAAVPVMIGGGMAWGDFHKQFMPLPFILCLLFAFVMQIDANFVNDYFDFKKGTDDESRLGPKRACAEGWVSVSSMRRAIVITTLLGCAIGLPLVFFGGLEMVLIGALCVLFCFLYSTVLSYLGLGDLLVLVFFCIVPVCLTYYLSVPHYNIGVVNTEVIIASIACGVVIDGLLVVNNYRDIDNDERAGKMTLMVRIGRPASKSMYLSIAFVACLMGLTHLFYDKPLAFILPLAYVPLHWIAWKKMCMIGQGRELNKVLGLTARNIFIYGILTAVGCLFSL